MILTHTISDVKAICWTTGGIFPTIKMPGRCSSMEHNIRNKIIIILSYLLIWALAIIVFWFFTSGSDAMGYSLMYLWIILPVTTFVESVLIGKNNFWGKGKWGSTLFFGLMYMLAEYGTFKMANNIATNKINAPDWEMIVVGAIISTIGILLGSLWKKKHYN